MSESKTFMAGFETPQGTTRGEAIAGASFWPRGRPKPESVDYDILKDPEYDSLKKHAISGNCVAFIGSGLSKGLYPEWDDLVNMLCKECGIRIDRKKGLKDTKVKLRFADRAFRLNKKAYCGVLEREFGKRVTQTRTVYDLLIKCKFKSYITTNFDPLLATEGRKPQSGCLGPFDYPNLPLRNINSRGIYYIHGRIEEGKPLNPNNIILGKRNFNIAYRPNERGTLYSFLDQLLTYEDILFIGGTLREPALESVVKDCKRRIETIKQENPSIRIPGRFILLPIRPKKEDNINEGKRFEELGIKVCRYNPGDGDHSGLNDLLEAWCKYPGIKPLTGFEEIPGP